METRLPKEKLSEAVLRHFKELEKGHTFVRYTSLLQAVFPPEEYPRAWNYKTGGGPPGVAMVFGKALRDAGLMRYRPNMVRDEICRRG